MGMIGNFLAVSQEDLDALLRDPSQIAAVLYETHNRQILDVDKAWHGIHFLLTGEQYGGDPPLANVVFGLGPIGNVDVGYGPALGTPAATVAEIAIALSEISANDFHARFNADVLAEANIYPEIWDEGEHAFDYMASNFTSLKEFYLQAAANRQAVITFIN